MLFDDIRKSMMDSIHEFDRMDKILTERQMLKKELKKVRKKALKHEKKQN